MVESLSNHIQTTRSIASEAFSNAKQKIFSIDAKTALAVTAAATALISTALAAYYGYLPKIQLPESPLTPSKPIRFNFKIFEEPAKDSSWISALATPLLGLTPFAAAAIVPNLFANKDKAISSALSLSRKQRELRDSTVSSGSFSNTPIKISQLIVDGAKEETRKEESDEEDGSQASPVATTDEPGSDSSRSSSPKQSSKFETDLADLELTIINTDPEGPNRTRSNSSGSDTSAESLINGEIGGTGEMPDGQKGGSRSSEMLRQQLFKSSGNFAKAVIENNESARLIAESVSTQSPNAPNVDNLTFGEADSRIISAALEDPNQSLIIQYPPPINSSESAYKTVSEEVIVYRESLRSMPRRYLIAAPEGEVYKNTLKKNRIVSFQGNQSAFKPEMTEIASFEGDEDSSLYLLQGENACQIVLEEGNRTTYFDPSSMTPGYLSYNLLNLLTSLAPKLILETNRVFIPRSILDGISSFEQSLTLEDYFSRMILQRKSDYLPTPKSYEKEANEFLNDC